MSPRSPSQGRGPTLRRGSGRHRKRGGSKGGDREKAGVGWGPSVPPACARVCATQVRGRKLLLLSHQLCRSRRQSRACPGPGPDFSSRRVLTRPGPGPQQCTTATRAPPSPQVPSPTSHQVGPEGPGDVPPTPLTTTPLEGYGCSHVADGENEAGSERLFNLVSEGPSETRSPAVLSPHQLACWPEPLPLKEQPGGRAPSSAEVMKRSSPSCRRPCPAPSGLGPEIAPTVMLPAVYLTLL